MLTINDTNPLLTRRELLRAGALALGGLSLSSLMAARATAAQSNLVTGKSVIFLFQQGGPPQFETFDPKPTAPESMRTMTGITQTTLPGVYFGDTMQQLARLAHKLTVVRSYQTNNAGHNIIPIVSPASLNANIGCLVSRVAGANHPQTAMPTNALLFPQAVCPDVTRGSGRGDMAATGGLGSSYAPFVPGGNGQLLNNLRLNLPPDRFQNRRELAGQLGGLQRIFQNEREYQTHDHHQRQATEVLLSGRVADALDLSREDPRLVAAYDTSRFVASDNWSQVNRGRRGYYTGQAKSLGKLLLMARRLCEAGCGFVTIHADYEGVWDFHADGNNLNVVDGMAAVGRSFDHAVAAFITDLEARGLDDKILLVCSGEMGRTPRINRNAGRDHWARLAPLMMYGGGTAGGRVIGRSNRDGGEPADTPYNTTNLISTILHTAFDVGQVRLQPALGAIARLGEIPPIPSLS
ncbi:MAG: DUF1501 domain-containing protein [Planctomycetes bacterium]|nr:DUF1501 domain-containing protein [Planctomycetota bacterium]